MGAMLISLWICVCHAVGDRMRWRLLFMEGIGGPGTIWGMWGICARL